jgi:hypothetical protein
MMDGEAESELAKSVTAVELEQTIPGKPLPGGRAQADLERPIKLEQARRGFGSDSRAKMQIAEQTGIGINSEIAGLLVQKEGFKDVREWNRADP